MFATETVTVPATIEHNRIWLDLEFGGRKAPAWVDSGNPDFLLSEHLARELGMDLSALPVNGRIAVPPPGDARIGGMRLSFEGVKAYVIAGRPRLRPSTRLAGVSASRSVAQ